MSRATVILLAMLLGLAACAAPQPAATAAGDASTPAGPGLPAPGAGPAPPRVPGPAPKIDYSCSSNAQCVVKDIGNCCGTMPACVNRDSPADPAAVQAQCRASGMMGVCGFREIDACQCTAGRCEPAPQLAPGSRR